MRTIIKEIYGEGCGWGSGFVLIEEKSPLFGLSCEELNKGVQVHGGLRFSQSAENLPDYYKVKRHEKGMWAVGFYTDYQGDTKQSFTKGKVYKEAKHLRRQLRSLEKQIKVHDLKILPEYFKSVIEGEKSFEVRKNDRGFKVGDKLVLWEFNNGYTEEKCERWVVYILEVVDGLEPGCCVMGISEERMCNG